MKKAKILSIVLAVVLVAGLLAGCNGGASSSVPASVPSSTPQSESTAPESTPSAGDAITVTDMMGREVTLDGPAEKVVAVTAADCEIIYALGAGNTMVGRGEYCDYPAEVLEVEAVQSGNDTNIEQIIALDPDVVFMATMAQDEGPIDQLTEAGIAVVVSDAKTIEEVYESIELIGTVLGKQAEAGQLVAEMIEGFGAIQDKVAAQAAEAEEKGIYFEISPLEYGLWTPGPGSFYQEIAEMLKVKNVFDDLTEPYAEVSEEQVIERNPDIIVTITMYFGEGPAPDEEILGRTGWQQISAVQNGTVFVANQDELSRPGPRLVQGAQSLYDFIYG